MFKCILFKNICIRTYEYFYVFSVKTTNVMFCKYLYELDINKANVRLWHYLSGI
jgi:hypothetical protein